MRRRAILGGILVAALVLRLIAIGDPLSNDEGYTWLVASAHGPGVFFDRLAAFENTPPLYYLLTWPLPDDGVAWLRIVSVLAGVGVVAAVWWLVQGLGDARKKFAPHSGANFVVVRGRAALFAAAALAVAPFAVSYSDYARGFVLADCALIVAMGALIRNRWWLYVAAAAVALYAEYDSALFLVALSFIAGWRALLPLAVLIPWIPQALSDSATKVSPVYQDPSPASLRDTTVRLVFGEHGTAHAANLRWLQFLLVAAVCAWAFSRAPRMLAIVAAATLALHALAHWIGPDVFAPRYLTELIPLTAAALGFALAQMRREVAVAAMVGIAALGIGVAVKRAGGSDEPDYKRLAALVAPVAQDRRVLTNSAVVAYYLRDLHPQLDRPFGLGRGLEAECVSPCLVVDDARVAGGARSGTGPAHAFGPIVVRASRK